MKRIHTTKQGDWNSLSAYLRDLSAQPQHSEDELRDIAARAAGGDVAAQESLVRAHLRLVVAIAQQYGSYGLPLADVISEGNIALIRAAQLYDPRFGTKFTTYASVWIKQRIHRAITKMARAVRIPVWRSQRLRKVARLNDELSAALGRAPTESELAGRLGLSEDELATLQRDRIEVASLDAPMRPDDEDSADVLQRIPDESTPDAASVTSQRELLDELMAALHDLDDRELEVVTHKFGLGKDGARSFHEIGRNLGKSHEWIRRIAQLAMVKIRRAMDAAAALPVMERLRRRGAVRARLAKLGATWQTAVAG
jgi:RNA polymerase sigma factor (sigma-70 family)